MLLRNFKMEEIYTSEDTDICIYLWIDKFCHWGFTKFINRKGRSKMYEWNPVLIRWVFIEYQN